MAIDNFPVRILLAITLLATALLFTNLSHRSLWQDEGETAVLAQSVLQYGYPRAKIANDFGENLVVQDVVGYDEHFRWVHHPWGQFYLAAGSIKLLGNTTLAARLPFALCGLATIVLTFVATWRLTRSPAHATLAATLLATTATFLNHSRQCRYHALSALTAMLLIWAFLEWLHQRRSESGEPVGSRINRRWSILVGVAAVGQFYADFATFFALIGCMMVLALFQKDRRRLLGSMVSPGLCVLMFIAPGLWLHGSRFLSVGDGPQQPATPLLSHLLYLDGWFVPLVWLIGGGVLLWRYSRGTQSLSNEQIDEEPRAAQQADTLPASVRLSFQCLIIVLVGLFVMAMVVPFPHVRYVVPLLAPAKIALAGMLVTLFHALCRDGSRRQFAVTVVSFLTLSLITSSVWSTPLQLLLRGPMEQRDFRTPDFCTNGHPCIRLEWPGYLYALLADFADPNTVTRDILDEHAPDSSRVLMTYGNLPALYARPDLLIQTGAEPPADLPAWNDPPDLIILRPPFKPNGFEERLDDAMRKRNYIERHYAAPATKWGNIAEPREHRYIQPEQALPMFVLFPA